MLAHEAIGFLVSRIQEQSQLEGVPLSDVEIQMLRWSEVEPDGIHNPALIENFETQYDSEEYEEKISGLASRAFQKDQTDPRTKALWDDLSQALKGRDYYVLVMLPGSRVPAVTSERSTLRDQLIYLAVGIAVVLVLVGIVIVTQR